MMNKEDKSATKRERAQQQYASARSNLLMMLAFTVINIILLVVKANVMLLFSATVPYYAAIMGILDETGLLFIPAIVVAVVSLAGYFLCWIFSKRHYGWMIAALVFFVLDTLCLGGLYILAHEISGILDVVFHLWVLYYLIIGVKSGVQLKKLPEEPISEEGEETVPTVDVPDDQTERSSYKRTADMNVKARILLEADVLEHHVCYRRVKRVNELVVDGYVYDEVSMLVEIPHELTAVVDGHTIQAGLDSVSRSYLLLDGKEIAKKMRIF